HDALPIAEAVEAAAVAVLPAAGNLRRSERSRVFFFVRFGNSGRQRTRPKVKGYCMQQGSKWKALTGWATVEGQWLRRKHFSEHALARIAERIRQGELGHTGELMVAIEAASPVH